MVTKVESQQQLIVWSSLAVHVNVMHSRSTAKFRTVCRRATVSDQAAVPQHAVVMLSQCCAASAELRNSCSDQGRNSYSAGDVPVCSCGAAADDLRRQLTTRGVVATADWPPRACRLGRAPTVHDQPKKKKTSLRVGCFTAPHCINTLVPSVCAIHASTTRTVDPPRP
jgi:hypothetical protein